MPIATRITSSTIPIGVHGGIAHFELSISSGTRIGALSWVDVGEEAGPGSLSGAAIIPPSRDKSKDAGQSLTGAAVVLISRRNLRYCPLCRITGSRRRARGFYPAEAYTRFIADANFSTDDVFRTSSLVSHARRACRIPYFIFSMWEVWCESVLITIFTPRSFAMRR